MKTHMPRSLALSASLLVFVTGNFAFLPSALARRAQAGAAVLAGLPGTAKTQLLPAHISAVVAGLQPIERLSATNRLNLAIGLPLRDREALARFLEQLYDPAHPNYRHYLTPEKFAARFGPGEQDYQAVLTFAQSNGLTVRQTHPNRTLVDVAGSVGDIERALHVTLRVYQHPTEGRTFYAPDGEPALDLAVPLLGIRGLDNYSLPRPRLQARRLEQPPGATPNAGSGPSGTYMGQDFRAAYVPGSVLTGAGQVVGLVQFDGYYGSDIAYYESQAGLPNVPLTNVLLDGFTGTPTGFGGEVEVCLDIEASVSMAPGLAGVIVYMAGPYGNWHDILNRMATDNLAKQLSCSWYMPGGGADPVADQILQQMAAQGQSFFNASGDYDAFTGPVDFPGETPYIVQVGGTTLTTSGPGGAWVSETVWNRGGGIGSGGGISTRYAIPSYQADISMTLNQGSTTMRNIPDVALTAENVYVRADGQDYSVGGTSCAAPLWAGFTALVNQQAVASGRPVVGFINPAVDAIGHAATYTACFHDITTGNNTSPSSPTKFYAVAGYDLCTGWGTPAGQSLINALATPDPLLMSPAGLAFSGRVGGPFSPNPGWLTLTNTGTNALSWTLVNTSAWFNVSPTSGTLVPGGAAASVSVSVDASAKALPAGVYPAVVAVTNLTSGVAQTCSMALSVAALSMADDFDPDLDLTQWSSFGGVVGSTVLATNYGGSVSAPNSLWFGDGHSRFATTIPINTSGGGQIGFCLRLADGSAWPWALVDNLPAEGVVLESSTNGGGNWTVLGNYDTPAYYRWTGVVLPIPAVAQGPAVVFRWRQLSNSGTNYDHWALDNVFIGTGPLPPRIVMDPQDQSVATGNTATLSVAALGTQPLTYQWLFNGTNLDGATGTSLVLTGARLSDAGTYSVFFSNSVGTAMSSNAVLTVYVPVCTPPASGLVSWWQGEGSASDWTGSNNGVLEGGVGFAAGEVGQAFTFNGTNADVRVPASTSLNVGLADGFTIETWINPADITQRRPLLEWNDGKFGVNFSLADGAGAGPGSLFIDVKDTGLHDHFFSTPGGLIASNVWQHVAVTYIRSTGNTVLYLNGLALVQATLGAFTPRTIGDLYFGLRPYDGGAGARFVGLMDEVSLYSRALSAAEIQALYNASSAGKCVTGTPPFISTQPADQTVGMGGTGTFSVAVGGTPPLSYQWRFNGTNLAGATSLMLVLANVQFPNAGIYSVVVTNLAGSVTSSNAQLMVTPSLPCAPLPAGLVAWWRGEGDASDSTGTNNGVLEGGVGFAAGEVGQAFTFNGTNADVRVPASVSLNVGLADGFTIETWINPADITQGRQVAEWNNGTFGVTFAVADSSGAGPGCLFISVKDTSLKDHYFSAAAGLLVSNLWQHVAATYVQSNGNTVLYINGVPRAQVTLGVFTPRTIGDLYFGVRPSQEGGPRRFVGLMDEVSLYNRALTAAEIQAIYNASSAGKCLTGTPPFISAQPASQTVTIGSTVAFTVTAGGTPPLSYHWCFDGTNLAGASSSALVLTNVQLANAGSYSVVVTNLAGSATSSNAQLTVFPASACVPAPSGLVSWWRAEGDASDSLRTNNGVLEGGVGFAAGEVGQAFTFNGTNADVRVPASASLNVGLADGFTIETWINPADITQGRQVVEWNNGSFGVTFAVADAAGAGPGSLFISVKDTGYKDHFVSTAAGLLVSNLWEHVAATYVRSNGNTVLYINGVPRAQATLGVFTPRTIGDLYIGVRPYDGGPRRFAGLMDEVSLYNRALSATEISAIYSAGSAGKCGLGPSILTPPQSQTVECSSNATFAVTASGLPPLAYRWYFGANLIPGATNTLLTLTNVGFAQVGNYSVVVTNAYGSATGGPAVLTVVDTIPPTILSCASNRTLSAGANCTATLPDLTGEVVATDASGPVTVTQNPPPGTLLGLGLTNITFTARDSSSNASVCASSLTVVDTTPPFVLACVLELTLGFDTNCQALLPDLTTTDYIIASDNCSSVSVAQAPPANTAMPVGTNTVVLTVSDAASNQATRAVAVIVPGEPHIAVQPANVAVAASSNATFSVTACGANPLVYQWQHASTNVPNGTNAVLLLSSVKTNDAGDYRVVIANPAGAITSVVATLTVLRPPVITRQPRSLAAAPGGSASFSVSVQGLAPFAYEWQKNGSPLAGQTKASLAITNVQSPDFGTYTVVVTNAYGVVLSDAAMLTLAVSPLITSLGWNTATLMLTVPTEVGPTYVLEYKDSLEDTQWNVLTTIAGTGLPIPITDNGLTNTTRFYRVRVR